MSIRVKLIIAYFLMIMFSITVLVFGMIRVTADFFTNISRSAIGDHSVDEVIHGVLNVLVDLEYMSRYDQALFSDEVHMSDTDAYLNEFNMFMYVEQGNELTFESEHRTDIPFESFYRNLIFMAEDDDIHHRTNEPFMLAEHTHDGEKLAVIRHVIDEDAPDKGNIYIVAPQGEMDDVGEKVFGKFFKNVLFLMLLVLLFMTVIVTQMVIKPLRILERSTVKIKNGHLDFSIKTKKKDELGQVMNAFDTMREELKNSIEQQIQYEENRKELITSISHDLKTPITSIKGYVEGIRDGVAGDQEKVDQYLGVIYQKSVDLDQLIDDLFLFSKLDLNRVPFNFTTVKGTSFFEDCYQEMKMDLEKVGFELTYDCSLDVDTSIVIDAQQFRRVIQNIVGNAVKYSTDRQEVVLRVSESVDEIHVEIQDFGKGISQEEIEQIFEKFYRCDPARNTDIGGSGLGLAIARQIVEQHSGSIWAASAIDEGTTIHITLERVTGEVYE